MKTKMTRLMCVLISLFVLACGGGGGGGGGGSDRGVRILHGVIESEPVHLQIAGNEGDFLSLTSFRNASGYFPLNEGAQTVQVFRQDNLSTPAVSAVAVIDPNTRYSLVYHGSRTTFGLRANLIQDNIPEEIGEGQVAVKFVHALVGASSIGAEAAGVGYAPVDFGSGTEYQILPTNAVTVRVTRIADGQTVVNQALTLEAGRAHTLLVTGEVDSLVVINNFQDN